LYQAKPIKTATDKIKLLYYTQKHTHKQTEKKKEKDNRLYTTQKLDQTRTTVLTVYC